MKKRFYTKQQRLVYGIGWFLISIIVAALFEYIGWTILTYISISFGLLSLFAIKERDSYNIKHMAKIKNINSLKKFSEFYKNYKIMDFNSAGNINKEDFLNNQKILFESLEPLSEIASEFDDTVPTTQITMQVVTEGFVEEQKFIDVQLNLKKWQEIAKMTDSSEKLQKILRVFTGFNL